MQVSDSVLIVGPKSDRTNKLLTILDFIGENGIHYDRLADTPGLLKDSQFCRCVIVEGSNAQDVHELRDSYTQQPFVIYHLEDDFDEPSIGSNLIGLIDFPLRYPQLTQLLHHCQDFLHKRPVARTHGGAQSMLFRSLVGRSCEVQEVRRLIEQVAQTEANVLVLGESGTGKEVVARNVHFYSKRREGPFIPVNCGAIPPELLESELFGHEKGAFTGAFSARKGRFELADGGTLFLDEIGDMPMPMQVKLLRVLQERTIERVGGNKEIKVDVRIIAATHRELENMITAGNFREDLYYRLNVFPIDTPSLRERKEDIPLLLQELVSRMESAYSSTIRFTQQGLESLMMNDWAGNVRELGNLVERLVILYPNQLIDVNDLPAKYRHLDVPEYQPDYPEEMQEKDAFNALFSGEEPIEIPDNVLHTELPPEGVNLKEMLSELEIDLIRQALEQQDHVVSRAAEVLGMRRTTLVEKMRKYGLGKDGR